MLTQKCIVLFLVQLSLGLAKISLPLGGNFRSMCLANDESNSVYRFFSLTVVKSEKDNVHISELFAYKNSSNLENGQDHSLKRSLWIHISKHTSKQLRWNICNFLFEALE